MRLVIEQMEVLAPGYANAGGAGVLRLSQRHGIV